MSELTKRIEESKRKRKKKLAAEKPVKKKTMREIIKSKSTGLDALAEKDIEEQTGVDLTKD